MVSNDPAGKRVKTTENAFAILRALKRLHGAGVSELADEVGLAKSTTHRHLGTLAQLGWVVEEADTYRIGFRFLEFGEHARQRKQGYRLAREKVEALADETAERVQFLVEENGRAVYVHRALGEHAVRTDPGIGSRIPLHATSGGKAILARLPESRVDEIIERRGLAALTPHDHQPGAAVRRVRTHTRSGVQYQRPGEHRGVACAGGSDPPEERAGSRRTECLRAHPSNEG